MSRSGGRLLLAGVLALVVGLIWLWSGSSPEVGPPELPPEETPVRYADQVIRPFQYTYTMEGRTVLEVKAGEARIFQEAGELALEDLELASFVDDQDRRYEFSAQQGLKSDARGEFRIQGQVQGRIREVDPEAPEIVIQTEEIIFSVERKLARAPGAVRIEREGIQTTADTMLVDGTNQFLALEGHVVTTLTGLPGEDSNQLEPPRPVVVRADRLEFEPDSLRARYLGHPMVEYGDSRVWADELILRMARTDRRLELVGEVRLEAAAEEAGGEPIQARSSRLEADLASRLLVFPERSWIARGEEELEADRLEILLQSEGGGLAGVIASGDVRLRSSEDREATCGRAVLDRFRQTLVMTDRPVVRQGTSQVTCRSIKVFMDLRLYELEGGIEGVYVPPDQSAQPAETGPTLFRMRSRGPVTFSAQTARIDGQAGEGRLSGDVVVRRGEESLLTELLLARFNPETREVRRLISPGRLRYSQGEQFMVAGKGEARPVEGVLDLEEGCQVFQGADYTRSRRMRIYLEEDRADAWEEVETYLENVRSVSERADDGEDEERAPLTVRADRAEFEDAKGEVRYRGSVTVRQEDLLVRCRELDVRLAEKSRTVQTILARGDVDLKRGELSALADELEFQQDREVIELRGTPAKIHHQDRSASGERIEIELATRVYRVLSGQTIFVPHLDEERKRRTGDEEEL